LIRLKKKGLVSETQIGKKVHYQAEPPERLETYVERQKDALLEQQKRLKDFIPQLKSIQRQSGERPMVKYFEGREGILSSLEEFYGETKEGGEVCIIYPRDTMAELFLPEERKKYHDIRVKNNVSAKTIYTQTKGPEPEGVNVDRKILDGGKYPISCDIAIYNDKVKISILGKHVSSIFIRSKDFAETMKSLFTAVFDSK